MKKNYFLGAFLIVSSLAYGQKTILVNGGQFGNQSENVNVMIRDVALGTSTVIDTIHTQSVQEILIEGDRAYVAAQDSLVAYDLVNEQRIAAVEFPGLSTKSLALTSTELLVGNFYGQSSNNLYIYNKQNLNSVDTIQQINQAVKSILVHGNTAYIPQNATTPNFEDTMGVILRFDLATRSIIDTLRVSNYTGDFGTLVALENGSGFLSINGASNSITALDYANPTTLINYPSNVNLSVQSRSHYSQHGDSLFLRTTDGIANFDVNTLNWHDSLLIDTLVTAFTYDTSHAQFYITQTDFFSYQQGQIYSANGQKTGTFPVGYSPEVLSMYYGSATSLAEIQSQADWSVYPNPSEGLIQIQSDLEWTAFARLQVYSQTGQLLMDRAFTSNSIDLTSLNSGIYLLRLSRGDQSKMEKIIIH